MAVVTSTPRTLDDCLDFWEDVLWSSFCAGFSARELPPDFGLGDIALICSDANSDRGAWASEYRWVITPVDGPSFSMVYVLDDRTGQTLARHVAGVATEDEGSVVGWCSRWWELLQQSAFLKRHGPGKGSIH